MYADKFIMKNVTNCNNLSQEVTIRGVTNCDTSSNIKDMKQLSERLKSRMKELELTQEVLANRVGLSRSLIAHYLKGARIPPAHQIIKLEAALHVASGWLMYGEKAGQSAAKTEDAAKHVEIPNARYTLPILPYHCIVDWIKDGILPQFNKTTDIIVLGSPLHPRSFIMQVAGDSMFNKDSQFSLSHGDYIVVEPVEEYKPGSLVVIRGSSSKEDIKIRQYQADGTNVFLKAFDPQLSHIPMSPEIEILGKVRQITKFVD